MSDQANWAKHHPLESFLREAVSLANAPLDWVSSQLGNLGKHYPLLSPLTYAGTGLENLGKLAVGFELETSPLGSVILEADPSLGKSAYVKEALTSYNILVEIYAKTPIESFRDRLSSTVFYYHDQHRS